MLIKNITHSLIITLAVIMMMDFNAYSQDVFKSANVGIGTTVPVNKLDVSGGEAVGSYAGVTPAPTNGIIVSGQVGIGTSSPNTGAVLDVESSSQGILIPQMTTAPTSPVQSMIYFNTTTGCFMFYTGSAWQVMACTCPNAPSTPGSVTGSVSTFCPGATGATYSISPISGANYYTWSVPSDATITAGQNTTSITVTFGSVSGNISVTANNNCGASGASTFTVTNGTPVITGQPVSPAGICAGSGTATFTVTATGLGLTYQWQEYVTSWNNITDGGVYSGSATATLTLTNPTSTMNGNFYRCIVTGTCSPSASSNGLAQLTILAPYVPITITNSQSTATSTNFAVKISPLNFSTYATGDGLNASLNNVEFTTGPSGTGTPLYAWIENGSSTTPATTPTSSSTAAIVWVNLGSTIINANSSITIYMNFMTSTVMTSATSYTGEAPQLSGTYAQYDNGTLVFSSFYDDFAGTSLASKWTSVGSGVLGVVVNNKFAPTAVINENWFGIYTNTFSSALNYVSETYAEITANNGFCINTSGTNGNKINNGSDGVDAQFQLSPNDFLASGGSCTTAPNANTTSGGTSPVSSTFYVFSFLMLNTPILQINYGAYTSLTGTGVTLNAISSTSEVGLGISAPSTGTVPTTFQWFRIRANPPSSVMPTVSLGSLACN